MGKIHNKQFIIADLDLEWDGEEWNPEKHGLFECYRIWYDKNLTITFGKHGVLIGDVFQGDVTKGNPEEVVDKDFVDVSKEFESWNGRWVLAYKNEVYLDANGQLGIFYGKIDGKHWVISSSLALINRAAKETHVEEFLPLDLTYNSLLYWNPGPRTLLKGIKRLLPSQLLRLEGEKVRIEYRDVINKHDFTGLAPEEIYEAIYEQQKNVFEDILSKFHKINLALTAGYDSRLQLAVLTKGNFPCSCHLFERSKHTARADEIVAPIIARKVGIEYKYIPLGRRIDAGRIMDYCKHTFNNEKSMDYKWHYPYHQFDELDGDVYVRAGLYEGFCNYYERCGLRSGYEDSVEFIMNDLKKMYITLEGNAGAEKSLEEYCQWVKEHPTKNMTFMDMLAYEQIYGCWMSDVSQAMDFVWGGGISKSSKFNAYFFFDSKPAKRKKKWASVGG